MLFDLLYRCMSVKTRQQRRKATTKLIVQLEVILDAELAYRDNIPINPQNAQMYEVAVRAVSALSKALQNLYDSYYSRTISQTTHVKSRPDFDSIVSFHSLKAVNTTRMSTKNAMLFFAQKQVLKGLFLRVVYYFFIICIC